MKYSIIISYRDREDHLSTLLPRLQEIFINESYEILIAEQDNDEKFQKNSLYNITAQKALGEIFIFHDVDYYPSDNVSYFTTSNIPLYPVRNVVFLNQEGVQRDPNDVPDGYKNFQYDVKDHSGGVFVLSKELFYKMNGLNPYYIGWGKEDDDTRDRLRLLGYQWERNKEGLFFGLYHTDNKPHDNDLDFINNHILLSNLSNTLNLGYKDVEADVGEFMILDNVRWLKIKNFKYADRNFNRRDS
jgi:predicted glycosyltransferase involved in capsule biosynthesis